MKIHLDDKCDVSGAEAVVIPVSKDDLSVLKKIDDDQLNHAVSEKLFLGKPGEIFHLTRMRPRFQHIFLVGLGTINAETVLYSCSIAYKKCVELRVRTVFTFASHLCLDMFRTCCEAAILSTYKFEKYKSEKNPCLIERFIFECSDLDRDSKIANEAYYRAFATMHARDLINEPPTVMTPQCLATSITELLSDTSVKVEALNKSEIEELKMTAFLEVGKGSIYEPRLIVMTYNGAPDHKERLGLIGKGLTYDSGGYSLQSSEFMETMQHDMSGGAAVAAALWAASKLNFPVNITAVIAACENKISATAFVPGDVIPSMSGKYIEVNNTDAEGRITIADAITYLRTKHTVDAIVDIATLTDAIQTALGDRRAGLFSNNKAIASAILRAGEKSVEPFWELPCDEHIRHVLDSRVAHLKNSAMGSSVGGYATVGAMFIKEFIGEMPWAHLDIGGVAWTRSDEYFFSKGGVGFGARMLCDFFKEWECLK